jgi:tetrahydromethanopterin S-methyltransferase subunit C
MAQKIIMNVTDKIIAGAIAGLIFALIGLGIRTIINAANKKKDLSQKKKLSLNSNEIIILSVVIGMFVALILGYIFSQHYSYYKGIKVYGKYDYHYLSKDSTEFNYLLAFGCFIVVSGISYIRLKRKSISKKD